MSSIKKILSVLCLLIVITISGIAQEVAPNGSLTYYYPINLPPGRNGMGPSLSIVYNSNMGNGMLGMGFALSGLSTITRDTSYAVDFDAQDNFVLDGQRLVYISGEDRYHTERENFALIQAVGLDETSGAEASDAYWVVTLKNGTKMYYGRNDADHNNAATDGRIEAVGHTGKALLWSLSRVEDVNGNYYIVDYYEDGVNGDYYPLKITWTKASGVSAYHTVEFFYDSTARTDHGPLYIPTKMDMNERLKWIAVKTNGNLVRKYRIDYGQYGASTGRSRIDTITEYGSDGNSPTYGTSPRVSGSYAAEVTGSTLPAVTMGWSGATSYNYNITDGWTYTVNTGRYIGWFNHFFTDVNGDGRADMISIGKENISYIELANLSGNYNIADGWTYTVNTGRYIDWFNHYFADVNGDGRTDMISIGNENISYIELADSTGNYNITDGWTYTINTGRMSGENVHHFADVNGDSRVDLIQTGNSNLSWVELADSTGNYNLTDGWTYTVNTGRYISWFSHYFADVNSDGRADMISIGNDNISYIELADSLGNFNLTDGWTYTVNTGRMSGQFILHFADINGDGRIDLIQTGNNDLSWIELSKSPTPDLLTTLTNPLGGVTSITYKPAPQVKNPDAVDPAETQYPKIANPSPRNLVTRIEVNPGYEQPVIATNYEYYNGMYYTGSVSERADLGFEWIKKIDDSATASEGTYTKTYYKQEKPYQGLVKMEELCDASDNPYKVVEYAYEKIANTTDPSINFIFKTDEWIKNYDGTTTCTTFHTKYYDAQYPGEYYDSYGNLKKVVNEGNADPAVTSDDVTVLTTYASNTTKNVFAPAKVLKYCTNLAGQTYQLASEERFFYDGSTTEGDIDIGLLTRKEIENGVTDLVLTFGYGSYGNLSWTKDGRANAGDYEGYTKWIDYDDTFKTYPIKETYTPSVFNQYTEIEYDSLMRPIVTKDVNGVSSYVYYDAFSRTWKTRADGDTEGSPTSEITYFDTATPRCIKTAAKNDTVKSFKYIDGLGRTIQEKRESEDGWITTDYFYDAAGRCYKTSVPYIASNYTHSDPPTQPEQPATTNLFDCIGRVIRTTTPDDTYTRTEYCRSLTTTYDPLGHKSEKEVTGNTTVARSYKYTPSFELYTTTTTQTAFNGTKITDTNGNIISTVLNKLGQKTSYTDPDMGTWGYTYDENGNLETQTDAKNQTISFTYDALGRVTLKDYQTGTDVHYFYDFETGQDHGYSKGRLIKVTYDGGEDFFVYDRRGRVTTTKRTLDGKTREISTTLFDSLDRPLTTVLPGGETLTNTYNAGGALETLSGTSSYVTDIDYTALGKVSLLAYGNNKSTTYDYYDTVGDNDSGIDLTFRLKSISVPGVMSLSYGYDTRGNIMTKTDNLESARSVTYAYDDFSRLTDATSNAFTSIYGNAHVTYSYNAINNLMSKESRTYSYYTAKPHQVQNDGTYTYTYDDNGNMLTRSDGRTMTYDYDNRLTSVSDGGSFWYDSAGQRTKKVEDGVTTYYFFGCYEEEWEDSALTKATKYYFANGMRIAERSDTDGLRYYHSDHLGSSTAVTDTEGMIVLQMGYTPYGSSAYSVGSVAIKYQYTGQEKDACGLMYYNARYYDPELGRFIQPDTMLDGLNRYTYCGGNPIVYCDPSGHVVDWWVYAIVYVCVAYFSGVQSSGSWNPADWSSNDWWMAATWGTGKIGFTFSTTSGPSIDIGDDIHCSPGEATRQQDTEQKIAQTQDNLMVSLVEYNTIMAEYSDFWNTLLNAGGGSSELAIDIEDIKPTPEPRPNLFLDDGINWFCGLMAYNVAVSRGTYLGWKPGVKLIDTPMPDTAGFIYFYAGKLDLKVEHVQYFEYFGGNIYHTWQTTGRGGDFPPNARNQLPHPVKVNIDNSNLNMWKYDHVKYYTIGPAPRINILTLSIPLANIFYVYPYDHRWKKK